MRVRGRASSDSNAFVVDVLIITTSQIPKVKPELPMYGLDVAATHCMNGWAGAEPHLRFSDDFGFGCQRPVVGLGCRRSMVATDGQAAYTACSSRGGFSFLLGLAINQLILLFIHRVRPYDAGVTNLLIARSGDFSFPSDHATASFQSATTSSRL
jgi:undecaprenyl-diphosphatase